MYLRHMWSLYPLIISAIYFTVNLTILHYGHFHEDAYILFIYVENLVSGNGITYFPTGAPIEGATDFLWMILISGLVYIGLDVSTAVIFLNSLGVFLFSTVIYLSFFKNDINELAKDGLQFKFLAFILIFLWVLQPYMKAAIGGFSVFLYLGIISYAIYLLYKRSALIWIPLISLVIALFRPDGVIIGFGLSLVGLVFSYQKGILKQYSLTLGLAFVLGCIYFVWRYSYFDNLLPLPLYVKSSEGGFSGLQSNITWLEKSGMLLITALITVILIRVKNSYFLLWLLIPAGLLFLSLSFATQSQNVGYRFQAPIFTILYLVFVFLVVELFKKQAIKGANATLIYLTLILLLLGANNTVKSLDYFTKFSYINEFPLKINSMIRDKTEGGFTIVLTEAGRIAYWNQDKNIKVIDAVGLNTVYPAKNTIDVNYIENQKPDLIMFHHAKTLPIKNTPFNGKKVYLLEDYELFNKLGFLNINQNSKVIHAANVLSEFLYKHHNLYDIYVVDYTEKGSYSHIYAVKKKHGLQEQFFNQLKALFIDRKSVSYYEMKSQTK